MTVKKTYNKKYMKRYQHKNAVANIIKTVLMLVMCICVLHLSGCATHEDSTLDGANSCAQILAGMRLGSEIVVVDYREVWYFEPLVKVYYIEEEK